MVEIKKIEMKIANQVIILMMIAQTIKHIKIENKTIINPKK